MAQTYQDFLGVGGTGTDVKKPYDPNDEPNPENPGGISNNQLTIQRLKRQRALANVPYGTGPDGSPIAGGGTVAPGAGGTASWYQVDQTGVPTGYRGPLGDTIRNKDPNAGGYKVTGTRLIQAGPDLDPAKVSRTQASQPAGPNVPGNPGPLLGVSPEQGYPNPDGNQPAGGPGGGGINAGPAASVVAANAAADASRATGAANLASGQANIQRVLGVGQSYADQNAADAVALTAQGAASANRAAPQMTAPSSANQQNALNAATNFQANTSGVAGIRGATADTSGAAALSSFRGDTQGINNLDRFFAENTQQGVNQLNAFQPTNTQAGVQNLQGFSAANTAEGIAGLNRFRPEQGMIGANNLEAFRGTEGEKGIAGLQSHSVQNTLQGASDLLDFRSSTSGINNLNAYANEGQGPSRAEALLRSQSDQDKRTAIALARSARGGPAAIAQAMRQAQSEGAAIAAETRGQAAALSAQEFDTYKTRQLASLQAAGQLISNADAQRLQALSDAGQLLSNADQQKLAAFQSIAQARTAQDMQRVTALAQASQARTAADQQTLGARTAAGQLGASIDAQNLGALTAAGQLQSNMDQQRLGAKTAAGQLQSNMDQQRLGASTAAGQLRLGNDTNRVNALNSAAQINLEGSRINQQGQIAATQAELAGSAQKLQALSLQGQISSDIRGQDIDVLKSNLSASLQQMNLNDTQVRAFAQMGQDAKLAGQNLNMQAQTAGLNADALQKQLALQWDQFAQTQLTDAQQADFNERELSAGIIQKKADAKQAQENREEDRFWRLLGAGFNLASDERAKKGIKPVNMAKALRDSPGSEYSYKDEKHGKGKFVGPMAQGLQKSKVFAGSVSEEKDGLLKVHPGRLVLTHHAALSHLQKEIDLLKRLRKTGKKEASA